MREINNNDNQSKQLNQNKAPTTLCDSNTNNQIKNKQTKR